MPARRTWVLWFLFLQASVQMFSQNLIPNPGFEELFTQTEFQWVQPQGPYYHYERCDSATHAPAHTGHYINGICMYPNEPNEYLHVKLLEPLMAGTAYRIEAWARLSRFKNNNAEKQTQIGIHFGKKRLDTHLPGDHNLEPQCAFHLPKGDRFEWFMVVDTFLAAGGEQYLTIGYFAATQRNEYVSRKQDEFMEQVEERYDASKKEVNEDMKWLYLPPEEQKKYLKQHKKANKKANKKSVVPPKGSPHPNLEDTGENNTDLTGVKDLSPTFMVRYYFDDFCLAEVIPGETTVCNSTGMGEVLEVGRSISLQNVFFDTDKAALLEESVVQLSELQRLLENHPSMRIEIRGYTDNRGSDAHNLDLSNRRAKAVVQWLTSNNVDAGRLTHSGFGSADPIATNDTEAGRALNRRVVFVILAM